MMAGWKGTLFAMSCGDLGLAIREVEDFRLGGWLRVLLLGVRVLGFGLGLLVMVVVSV